MNTQEFNLRSALTAVIMAGFIAGSLDALAAVAILGKFNYVRVFQFVASGIFGQAAFAGGFKMVLYGIIFHYFIAFTFATFFLILVVYFPILKDMPFLAGIAYGIFVWLVMNLLVLPQTHVPQDSLKLNNALINMLILILMIGLPISYLTNWIYVPHPEDEM
ncbi:MAG: hypothetical protein QM669_05655 [Siphonobacter sp.]